MFIHVRSVVLSHEWEVIVDPSTDAALPTRTLVQPSQLGQMNESSRVACDAPPVRTSSQEIARTQVKSRGRDGRRDIGRLLRRGQGGLYRNSWQQAAGSWQTADSRQRTADS